MTPFTAALPGETTEPEDRTRTLQAALVSMPNHRVIVVPGDLTPAWAHLGDPNPDLIQQAFPTETWTVRMVIGPVPFIGDPDREAAHVVWRVAVCDQDHRRQVASTFSRLEIRSRVTGLDLTSWRQWELREYGSAS